VWRDDDVPDRMMAFADPLIQRSSWTRSEPYTENDSRSYLASLRAPDADELGFALASPADACDVLGGA